jgi:hypothetical protein
MIVSVYDRKKLHRVATARLDENIQVCQTFLANTKDLFVVIKKQKKFIIMMLDLDAINSGEADEGVDESNYRFKKVFEYDAADVGDQDLKSMFVRGSSRKEVIKLNHQLLIFLLHG